ncbi:MAG: HPr family phosphocarrier protein [Gammaproteobacteria bacterium]|jgi:phosphocarrier protein
MISTQTIIINKLGLHARAAAKLVSLCARYESEITLQCKGKTANAKSIMAVMMLAGSIGTEIEINASGADEQMAIDAILALIQAKFGEAE